MAQSDRFTHNDREYSQFQTCGIKSHGLAGFFLVGSAPIKVVKSVPISDGFGGMVVFELEPERKPLPGVQVTLLSAGAFAVPLKEPWSPGVPPRRHRLRRHCGEALALQVVSEGCAL